MMCHPMINKNKLINRSDKGQLLGRVEYLCFITLPHHRLFSFNSTSGYVLNSPEILKTPKKDARRHKYTNLPYLFVKTVEI